MSALAVHDLAAVLAAKAALLFGLDRDAIQAHLVSSHRSALDAFVSGRGSVTSHGLPQACLFVCARVEGVTDSKPGDAAAAGDVEEGETRNVRSFATPSRSRRRALSTHPSRTAATSSTGQRRRHASMFGPSRHGQLMASSPRSSDSSASDLANAIGSVLLSSPNAGSGAQHEQRGQQRWSRQAPAPVPLLDASSSPVSVTTSPNVLLQWRCRALYAIDTSQEGESNDRVDFDASSLLTGTVDTTLARSFLHGLQELFTSVIMPGMQLAESDKSDTRALEDARSPQASGSAGHTSTMHTVGKYVGILHESQDRAIPARVRQLCSEDLASEDCVDLKDTDTATSLLSQWLAVVTHALIEDDSSRISDTKAGPHTELQYWQRRALTLQTLLDHVQGTETPDVVPGSPAETTSPSAPVDAVNGQATTHPHKPHPVASKRIRSVLQCLRDGVARKALLSSECSDTLLSNLRSGATLAGNVEYELAAAVDRSRRRMQALLTSWQEAMTTLHESTAESHDNVKYLYSMQVWLEPLYVLPLSQLTTSLPATISALGRMMVTARFFRSVRRMTTMMCLMSSHLVTMCLTHMCEAVYASMVAREADALRRTATSGAVPGAAAVSSTDGGPPENILSRIPIAGSVSDLQRPVLLSVRHSHSEGGRRGGGHRLQRSPHGSSQSRRAIDGSAFWQCDSKEIIRRCRSCLRLLKSYKLSFRKTKALLATKPTGPQFAFDMSLVFWRVNLLGERLRKIWHIAETVSRFDDIGPSSLGPAHHVQESMKRIRRTLCSLPYDPLQIPTTAPGAAPLSTTEPSPSRLHHPSPSREARASHGARVKSRLSSPSPTPPATSLREKPQRLKKGLHDHYLSAGSPRQTLPNGLFRSLRAVKDGDITPTPTKPRLYKSPARDRSVVVQLIPAAGGKAGATAARLATESDDGTAPASQLPEASTLGLARHNIPPSTLLADSDNERDVRRAMKELTLRHRQGPRVLHSTGMATTPRTPIRPPHSPMISRRSPRLRTRPVSPLRSQHAAARPQSMQRPRIRNGVASSPAPRRSGSRPAAPGSEAATRGRQSPAKRGAKEAWSTPGKFHVRSPSPQSREQSARRTPSPRLPTANPPTANPPTAMANAPTANLSTDQTRHVRSRHAERVQLQSASNLQQHSAPMLLSHPPSPGWVDQSQLSALDSREAVANVVETPYVAGLAASPGVDIVAASDMYATPVPALAHSTRRTTLQQEDEVEKPASKSHVSSVEKQLAATARADLEAAAITVQPQSRQEAKSRQSRFDADYGRFCAAIDVVEREVVAELEAVAAPGGGGSCHKLLLVHASASLRVMGRPVLRKALEEAYQSILRVYRAELAHVKQQYTEHRDAPPTARNMPPVVGRIHWSRQLLGAVEEPMHVFQQVCPHVLKTPDGVAAHRSCSSARAALLKYEKAWHQAWCTAVVRSRVGTNAPLLARHPATGQIAVNLDPQTWEVVREAQCMVRLGMPIPDGARQLQQRADSMRQVQSSLAHALSRYEGLTQEIPEVLVPALSPLLEQVVGHMKIGWTTVTWSSPRAAVFARHVTAEVDRVAQMLHRVSDVMQRQIAPALVAIRDTSLLDMSVLPSAIDEPKTDATAISSGETAARSVEGDAESVKDTGHDDSDEASQSEEQAVGGASRGAQVATSHSATVFLNICSAQVAAAESNIRRLSAVVEGASRQMMGLVMACFDAASSDVVRRAEQCLAKAMHQLESQTYAGIKHAVLQGLRALRNRVSTLGAGGRMSFLSQPLFRIHLSLTRHGVQLRPSLAAIQAAISELAQRMVLLPRGVPRWTPAVTPNQMAARVLITAGDGGDGDGPGSAHRQRRGSILGRPTPRRASLRARRASQVRGGLGSSPRDTTFFYAFARSKEVLVVVLQLSGTLAGVTLRVRTHVSKFDKYSFLWTGNSHLAAARFLEDRTVAITGPPPAAVTHEQVSGKKHEGRDSQPPTVSDFEEKLVMFRELEDQLKTHTPARTLDALYIVATPLLKDLCKRAHSWRNSFGHAMRQWAQREVEQLSAFFRESHEALSTECATLPELSTAMASVAALRRMEADIDMKLVPVLEAHDMMQRFHVDVGRSEGDEAQVEELAFTWTELKQLAEDANDALQKRSTEFRGSLRDGLRSLHSSIQDYSKNWEQSGLEKKGVPLDQARKSIAEFSTRFAALVEQQGEVIRAGKVFGYTIGPNTKLLALGEELDVLRQLYALHSEASARLTRHRGLPWNEVNVDDITEDVDQLLQAFQDQPPAAQRTGCFVGVVDMLHQFKTILPLVGLLRHDTIRPRHWGMLQEIMGVSISGAGTPKEASSFTLKDLLEAPLLRYRAAIESVCAAARKEAEVESKLGSIRREWLHRSFCVGSVNSRHVQGLLSPDTAVLLSSLDEAQTTLTALQGTRHHLPFARELSMWVRRLAIVADVLEPWVRVQALFIYLEAVFHSSGIAKQLPSHARRFAAATRIWSRMIARVAAQPSVLQVCCHSDTVRHGLAELWEQLELCQVALSGYLADKRDMFPRFYFVSDTVLLELLARGSQDPAAVSRHLPALADGAAVLLTSLSRKTKVVGVMSAQAEELRFPSNRSVSAEGPVEVWLDTLLEEIRFAVEVLTAQAITVANASARTGLPFQQAFEQVVADSTPVRLEQLLSEDHHGVQVSAAPAVSSTTSLTWLTAFPMQMCILAARVLWTALVERGISTLGTNPHSLQLVRAHVTDRLRDSVESARQPRCVPKDEGVAPLARARAQAALKRRLLVLEGLITLHTHQRDVCDVLVHEKPRSVEAFVWRRNLRSYYDVRLLAEEGFGCSSYVRLGNSIQIDKMQGPIRDRVWGKYRLQLTDIDVPYDNEYIGSCVNMVMTPLTLRCHVTIVHALHQGRGASAVGPAGTGKTETIRDLGRCFGRFVLVLNCGQDMTVAAVGRLLRGPAASGAWVGLDEFNRIPVSVLSVVASQIQCVLHAMRSSATHFAFSTGRLCSARPTRIGLFTTMNPGYKGRTSLPESIKALFRGVAMIVPDAQAIVRVRLAALGFRTAWRTAHQLQQLLHAADTCLSPLPTYDWGLRTAIAIVRGVASELHQRHAAMLAREDTEHDVPPDSFGLTAQDEVEVVAHTLCQLVLPSLSEDDTKPFLDLVALMFPASAAVTDNNNARTRAVRAALTEAAAASMFVSGEAWCAKGLQLHSMLHSRTGVVLLGPARSGKSVLLQTLVQGLPTIPATPSVGGDVLEGIPIREVRIFVKAVSPSELYGRWDPVGADWMDGVFARHVRRACENHGQRSDGDAGAGREHQAQLSGEGSGELTWLVMDGPVEPMWVENLNSMLDDSRQLTLTNGDRLQVPPGMKIVIETDSLVHASPATVSRCGIVSLDGSNITTWQTLVEAWLSQRRLAESRRLLPLFASYLTPILNLAGKITCGGQGRSVANRKTRVEASVNAVVRQLLVLLTELAPLVVTNISRLDPVEDRLAMAKANAAAIHEGMQAHAPDSIVTGELMATREAAVWGRCFVMAVVWACGSHMDAAQREYFDARLRSITSTVPSMSSLGFHNATALWEGVTKGDRKALGPWPTGAVMPPLLMPSKPSSAKRTVFDYFINEHGEWNRWLARLTIPPAVARASGGDLATSVTPWRMAFDAIKPAACGSGIPIATRLNLGTSAMGGDESSNTLLMPTVTASQTWYLMTLLATSNSCHRGTLLAGPSACGKSHLARKFVSRLASLSREAILDRVMRERGGLAALNAVSVAAKLRSRQKEHHVAKHVESLEDDFTAEHKGEDVTSFQAPTGAAPVHVMEASTDVSGAAQTSTHAGGPIRAPSAQAHVFIARSMVLHAKSSLSSVERRLESMMDRKVGRLFVSPPSLDMAELMQEQDPVSHASAGGPLPSRRSGRTTAADADNGTTPATTSVALFIDDLGLPQQDEWGDSSTAELVRQLIEREEYHAADTRSALWTQMKGLRIVSALRLGLAHSDLGTQSGFVAGDGFPSSLHADSQSLHAGAFGSSACGNVSARLVGQFHILHITEPSDEEVVGVFRSMLEGHFSTDTGFNRDCADMACLLLPAMTVDLVRRLRRFFQPSPTHPHLQFGLRDAGRVITGVVQADWEVVSSPDVLLRLWRHESTRELGDRMDPGMPSFRFQHAVHVSMKRAGSARRERVLQGGDHSSIDKSIAQPEEPKPPVHVLSQDAVASWMYPRLRPTHDAALEKETAVLEDEIWCTVHATVSGDASVAAVSADKGTGMTVAGRVGHQLYPGLGAEPDCRMVDQKIGEHVTHVRKNGSLVVPEVIFLDSLYHPSSYKEHEKRFTSTSKEARKSNTVDESQADTGPHQAGRPTDLGMHTFSPAAAHAIASHRASVQASVDEERRALLDEQRRMTAYAPVVLAGGSVRDALGPRATKRVELRRVAEDHRALRAAKRAQRRAEKEERAAQLALADKENDTKPPSEGAGDSGTEAVPDTGSEDTAMKEEEKGADGIADSDTAGAEDTEDTKDTGVAVKKPDDSLEEDVEASDSDTSTSSHVSVRELRQQPVGGRNFVAHRMNEMMGWYNDNRIPVLASFANAKPLAPLRLVLFERAVSNLCRAVRILRMPGRHAVFVGVDGCGKRSVARLAAFMAARHVVELSGSAQSMAHIRFGASGEVTTAVLDDVRSACKEAGVGRKRVVVIVCGSDLQDASCAHAVSTVLDAHDPLSLFGAEEQSRLLADLPDESNAPHGGGEVNDSSPLDAGDMPTVEEPRQRLARRFNTTVLQHLQVVMCVSPGGGDSGGLHAALKAYPGILPHCTPLHFRSWTHHSRVGVATAVLPTMEWYNVPWQLATIETSGTDYEKQRKRRQRRDPMDQRRPPTSGKELGLRESITNFLSSAHASVEAVARGKTTVHTDGSVALQGPRSITPRSFLQLLHTFGDVVMRRYRRLRKRQDRLAGGLASLSRAANDVTSMGVNLRDKETELAGKDAELAQLLNSITDRTQFAEEQKVEILDERNEIALQARQVAKDLALVEAELAAAEPAMRAAVRSLQKITQSDISTVRTFSRPPNLIKRILDGVLLLRMQPMMPVQPDPDFDDGRLLPSWAQSKLMLGQFTFLRTLMEFRKESLNEETLELLAPYLEMEDFDASFARRTCGNMAGLCTWVQGLATWFIVSKSVKPKQEAVAVAQAAMDAKRKQLQRAEASLVKAEMAIQAVMQEYEECMQSKAELKVELTVIRAKLDAATKLLGNLDGEQDRWKEQHAAVTKQLGTCIGDALLHACFIVYSGPYSQATRQWLRHTWRDKLLESGIPVHLTESAVQFFASPTLLSQWSIQGVTSDAQARENALLSMSACAKALAPPDATSGSDDEDQVDDDVAFLSALGNSTVPVFLDPQGIMRAWLTNAWPALEIATGGPSSGSSQASVTLRKCMETGTPVLVQDCNLLSLSSQIQSVMDWQRSFSPEDVDPHTSQVQQVTAKFAEAANRRDHSLNVGVFETDLDSEDSGDEVNGAESLLHKRVLGRVSWPGPTTTSNVVVEILEGFRLFVTSRQVNPRYSASLPGLARIINCVPTPSGLQERLLGVVVSHERAGLEVQRVAVETRALELERKSQTLASQLLRRLTSTTGSLLDDMELMSVLVHTKETAAKVEAKRVMAKTAIQRLQNARDVYQPVAERGSIIYFCARSMRRVQASYRFSFQNFLRRFQASLRSDSTQSGEAGASGTGHASQALRVRALCRSVAKTCSSAVMRGLFAQHRPAFALAVAIQVDLTAAALSTSAVTALLSDLAPAVRSPVAASHRVAASKEALRQLHHGHAHGSHHTSRGHAKAKSETPTSAAAATSLGPPAGAHAGGPGLPWLPDSAFKRLASLHLVPALQPAVLGLHKLRSMSAHLAMGPAAAWKKWFLSKQPETLPIPSTSVLDGDTESQKHSARGTSAAGSDDSACETMFHRLLVVSKLRPDRIQAAASAYLQVHPQLRDVLSLDGNASPGHSTSPLTDSLFTSHPDTPLLVLVSPGTDVATAVQELQSAHHSRSSLVQVSAGRGQHMAVMQAVHKAMLTGSWLLVQNCHLAPVSLVKALENLMTAMSVEQFKQQRQVATTAPSSLPSGAAARPRFNSTATTSSGRAAQAGVSGGIVRGLASVRGGQGGSAEGTPTARGSAQHPEAPTDAPSIIASPRDSHYSNVDWSTAVADFNENGPTRFCTLPAAVFVHEEQKVRGRDGVAPRTAVSGRSAAGASGRERGGRRRGASPAVVPVMATFRLILSADASPALPAALLQSCVLVSMEAAGGTRDTMQASLASLDPRLLQSADQPAKWRRLLYTTCFLHCALRLRNRFGRAGWSVPYASSPTDLLSSVHYLREAARDMDTLGGVDWAALRFLVCEVFFGGSVTDDMDARVIRSYGHLWFKSGMTASSTPSAAVEHVFRLSGAGIVSGSVRENPSKQRQGPKAKMWQYVAARPHAAQHKHGVGVAASSPRHAHATAASSEGLVYRVPGSEADSVDTLLEFVARLPNSQAPQVAGLTQGVALAATQAAGVETLTLLDTMHVEPQPLAAKAQFKVDLHGSGTGTGSGAGVGNVFRAAHRPTARRGSYIGYGVGAAALRRASPLLRAVAAMARASRDEVAIIVALLRGLPSVAVPIPVASPRRVTEEGGAEEPWWLHDSGDSKDCEEPMKRFVRAEIDVVAKSVSTATDQLRDLLRVLRNHFPLLEEQQGLLQHLRNGRTPSSWQAHGFEPHRTSLSAWMHAASATSSQLLGWARGGTPPAVWLGGLVRPRAMMLAMRQVAAARGRGGVQLDAIRVVAKVLTEENLHLALLASTQSKDAGFTCTHMVVDGLVLQSASWDDREQELVNLPGDELADSLPPVHLVAVEKPIEELLQEEEQQGDNRDAGARLVASYKFVYHCPVYRSTVQGGCQRDNWVLDIDLATSVPPGHWSLRGCAILCQLPEE